MPLHSTMQRLGFNIKFLPVRKPLPFLKPQPRSPLALPFPPHFDHPRPVPILSHAALRRLKHYTPNHIQQKRPVTMQQLQRYQNKIPLCDKYQNFSISANFPHFGSNYPKKQFCCRKFCHLLCNPSHFSVNHVTLVFPGAASKNILTIAGKKNNVKVSQNAANRK